jgi:hypothetical protein
MVEEKEISLERVNMKAVLKVKDVESVANKLLTDLYR